MSQHKFMLKICLQIQPNRFELRKLSLHMRTLAVGGSITVQPVYGYTSLDCTTYKYQHIFFVGQVHSCSTRTGCTVILPLMLSVLCLNPCNYLMQGLSIECNQEFRMLLLLNQEWIKNMRCGNIFCEQCDRIW